VAADVQAMLLQSDRQSALGPMDAACGYIRARFWRLLLTYLLLMIPYSAVMLMLVDIVTSEYRARVSEACFYLTLATFWRWIGQAKMQADILRDSGMNEVTLALKHLFAYLVMRLLANFLLVWLGILIVPIYYGLYLAGFAAPALLQHKDSGWTIFKRTFSQMHQNADRLSKVLGVTKLLFWFLLLFAIVIQGLLVATLFPSLLGIDTADAQLTFGGFPWVICGFYFVFLIVDFYWTVLCAILYDALQARRRGFDLVKRIDALEAVV